MSTTVITSATLRISVNCTSRTEARMLAVASCTMVSVAPTGIERCKLGQLALDALRGLDHVGAGLALDVDDDGRHPLVEAADLVVLQTRR